MNRVPALDGLRGLAILVVVVDHATGIPLLRSGGAVGVTAFFALSGFLITGLLLGEPSINLRAFYERRARRLFPALAVFLAVVLVLALTTAPTLGNPRDLVPVALYVGNWPTAFGAQRIVLHTWSLSVEEQFYIAWPLLLIAARRIGLRVHVVAIALAVASLLTRLVILGPTPTWDEAIRVYYGTDTTAFALLAGCAAAAWIHERGPVRATAIARPAWALLAITTVSGIWLDMARLTLVPVVAAVATVVLLLAASDTAYRGFLTARWLRFLGQRSYGLYLWHGLALWFALTSTAPHLITVPLSLAAAWCLTLLSWRYVESPWLSSAKRGTVPTYVATP